MIRLKDIETALAQRLKNAGHSVTAAETLEGFEKPTFFIDIFQNSVTLENPFMELVNVGVELRYFPAVKTREELVDMADSLRDVLMEKPLAVASRALSVLELEFETDKTALLTYFELEFMREPSKLQEESEKTKNLQIGVKHRGYPQKFAFGGEDEPCNE